MFNTQHFWQLRIGLIKDHIQKTACGGCPWSVLTDLLFYCFLVSSYGDGQVSRGLAQESQCGLPTLSSEICPLSECVIPGLSCVHSHALSYYYYYYYFYFYLLIYLTEPSLSCGTRDLRSSLWHVESITVPWPGMEPRPSALGARSLTHWTTREVPVHALFLTSVTMTFLLDSCHTSLGVHCYFISEHFPFSLFYLHISYSANSLRVSSPLERIHSQDLFLTYSFLIV